MQWKHIYTHVAIHFDVCCCACVYMLHILRSPTAADRTRTNCAREHACSVCVRTEQLFIRHDRPPHIIGVVCMCVCTRMWGQCLIGLAALSIEFETPAWAVWTSSYGANNVQYTMLNAGWKYAVRTCILCISINYRIGKFTSQIVQLNSKRPNTHLYIAYVTKENQTPNSASQLSLSLQPMY